MAPLVILRQKRKLAYCGSEEGEARGGKNTERHQSADMGPHCKLLMLRCREFDEDE